MPAGHLTFGIVDPALGWEAFQWHRDFAGADNHIFPRTWEEYGALAEQGRIFSATESNGNYIGLAYFNFKDGEWEVGGLMVSASHRNSGVGSTLMRLTLGHVLFEEDPLSRGEPVIAHVHAENNDPRPIIQHKLRFRYRKSIHEPAAKLPGLKADEDGIVHGDEFELTIPDSLNALAEWCLAWNGAMKNGQPAQIEFRPGITLEMWAKAFLEMAQR